MISSVSVLFLYHDVHVGMSLFLFYCNILINFNQVFSTLDNLCVLQKLSNMFMLLWEECEVWVWLMEPEESLLSFSVYSLSCLFHMVLQAELTNTTLI